MSDWQDEAPQRDPVYATSRPAAPGGVPLGLSMVGLIVVMILTLLVHPGWLAAIPIGFLALQHWIGGDLAKPRITVGYVGGAARTTDPVIVRPDGSKGLAWGGSTLAALPEEMVCPGRPRGVLLPKD